MAHSITIEKAAALRRYRDQQRWIEQHGGSRLGYRERYGVRCQHTSDTGFCAEGLCACWYGDGGDAIYEADMAQLQKLAVEAGLVVAAA
jgi:hypothetical protein